VIRQSQWRNATKIFAVHVPHVENQAYFQSGGIPFVGFIWRNPFPDALALRALRPESDVQPALRHATAGTRHRRTRRHRRRLHTCHAEGRQRDRLCLSPDDRGTIARYHPARHKTVSGHSNMAHPAAQRHGQRLQLAHQRRSLPTNLPNCWKNRLNAKCQPLILCIVWRMPAG